MKIILFFFFLLVNINVLAQQINGFVYDNNTKKPISNVTIWSNNSTNIVITDSTGHFIIANKQIEKFYVSHIGYRLDSILENFKTGDTLFLQAKIKKNEDVIVYGHKNYVEKSIGSLNKRRLTSRLTAYSYYQIGRFFSGTEYKEGSIVNSISFKLFKLKLIPENVYFKIEVFTYDSINNTIEELLEESIFERYKKNDSKIFFDLEQFNVKLPKDGFYVCIKTFRDDNWTNISLNNARSPLINAESSLYDLPPKLMYLNKIDRIQLNVERYVPQMLIKIKSPK